MFRMIERRCRWLLALACIGAGLAATGLEMSDAHAGNGALLIRGASGLDERSAASVSVREALQQSGWQLSKRQFSEKEAEAAAACLRNDKPWSCMEDVLREPSLEHLAIVSVDPKKAPDGTPLTLVTARIVMAKQNLAYGDEQYCEKCNAERVKSTALAVTTKVLGRIYLDSNRSLLNIRSTPAGARIVLDGKVMGASNLALDILPGRHTVNLSLRGYRAVSRSVDVVDGEAAEVNILLEPEEQQKLPTTPPIGDGAPSEEVRILPGWVPPTTLGVGVAAVIAGSVLLYTGRDQPEGEVQNQYNVSVPGVVTIGLGVAITGLGAYLWRWPPTRSSRETATKSTIPGFSATPLPRGLAASFETSF